MGPKKTRPPATAVTSRAQRKKTKTAPSLQRKEVSILSPLRYPGAKRRHAGYIKEAFCLNGLHPELFIEPFAGGASVALQLANDRVVERIGLIERDPLVAAFWKTVFFDADWLVRKVMKTRVTVKQWQRLKRQRPRETRARAYACLYLNRTSFSGILAPGAGPLGGYSQASVYGIDCRFPKETLIRRIRQAEALRDKVAFVWNLGWADGLARIHTMQERGTLPPDAFYYVDPPFFEKADRLYNFYFKDTDHYRLRDALLKLQAPWILSYDASVRVMELYGNGNFDPVHLELLYGSPGNGGSTVAREVLLTNLDKLPAATRLWRRNEEWRKNGVHLNGVSRPSNGVIKNEKHRPHSARQSAG